jgi:hypothetical protein
MNEQPERCSKFDFLPKLVDRFRNLHLRHIIVTDIYTGKVTGMINRGDIFTYMPL